MMTAVGRYSFLLIAAIWCSPALAEAERHTPAAQAFAPVGDAVFPSAIDPKYAKETPAKARVHTCIDQYNTNKTNNSNGGRKWIEKGGGYYSECNKRLGGMSPGPAPVQLGGGKSLDGEELDERYTAWARGAFYKVEDDASNQGKADDVNHFPCVYRNNEKFLCPNTERIAFEKRYRTKDYDFLVISTSFSGTGNRWWDWKLIVEDGRTAVVKPLATECLACDIRVEKLNFQSNEIVFAHRQSKQLQAVTFRAGRFTSRKSKLNPQEPLDKDTCSDLLGRYEYCRKAEPGTIDCSMALANSGHFSLLRIEDQYAGISYEGMQRMCRAACSSGKAMDNKTFLRKICRRSPRGD